MKNASSNLLIWKVSVCLTVIAVALAFAERGYFAIGGEWFVWIVPAIIHMERKYQI